MTIDLYVMSRGPEIEQDYGWVHVKGEQQEIKDLPTIARVDDINRLIFSERFSLFLGCYVDGSKPKLILQVTGLYSQRTDYQSRRIRNTFACIGDANPEDEMILRGIAVEALEARENLERLVDGRIVPIYVERREDDSIVDAPYSKEGYRVDGEELLENLEKLKMTVGEFQGDLDIAPRVGKNVSKLRSLVAEQLKRHCPPPQQTIVVVTDFILEDIFSQHNIWRGLSDQIDQHLTEEQAELREYKVNSPKPLPRLGGPIDQILSLSKNLLSRFRDSDRPIIISVIMCLAALIAIYLWQQQQQP